MQNKVQNNLHQLQVLLIIFLGPFSASQVSFKKYFHLSILTGIHFWDIFLYDDCVKNYFCEVYVLLVFVASIVFIY